MLEGVVVSTDVCRVGVVSERGVGSVCVYMYIAIIIGLLFFLLAGSFSNCVACLFSPESKHMTQSIQ